MVVDSGTLSVEISYSEVRIGRHGRLGVAEEAVRVDPDEQILLQPGDSLTFGGEAAYSLHNGGAGPLGLLAAELMDPTQPSLLCHEH